ncbi:MAG: hypothetical protein GX649_14755 [Chloroflexi bacterium]|nr:hypothetical protein [Chloroflexota bacterium]
MTLPRWFLLIAFALACAQIGCASTPPADAAPLPDGEPTVEIQRAYPPAAGGLTLPTADPARHDCLRLDSVLFGLAQADDPLDTAQALGLPVRDGRIQVIITLAGEDAEFLSEYDAEVGSRSEAQVQAYIPPANLCALGSDDRVEAVRAPDLVSSW